MSERRFPPMRNRLLWAAIALATSALTACGPGGPLATRLSPDIRRPPRGVVLFICDGLERSLLERGCREGWLPNIQRRLVAEGVRVEHAVCEMPSITYSNMSTFATGVVPGRHGVLGNSWFDPRSHLFRDYSLIATYTAVNDDVTHRTLYERMAPATSASIQSPVTRGVTQNFPNWAVSGVMWFFEDYTAVDKLTTTTVDSVAAWANWHKAWPTLLTCYYPGVDTVGHRFGPQSARYRASVEHFDYQLGRVCDWLERERLLDSTTIILVSDHGLVPCKPGGVVDLHEYARANWNRTVAVDRLQQESPQRRAAYYERFDTVIVDKGVRFASIHLRGAGDWDSDPPAPAEVTALLESATPGSRLWELAGVDLLAYLADAGVVALHSARGVSWIRIEGGVATRGVGAAADGRSSLPAADISPPWHELRFRYDPGADDVLEFMSDPTLAAFVRRGAHGEREWLAAARGAEFPAIVAQLPRLLAAPRAGQIVMFAAPEYSFTDEEGGHGGIRRNEVCIPMLFAGPGLPRGSTIPLARGADLVPTVLGLIGTPAANDWSLDGVALFPAP